MTIVKCYTRVVSTTVSKIFMLANTEIFIFAYGHEFRQFLRMTHTCSNCTCMSSSCELHAIPIQSK